MSTKKWEMNRRTFLKASGVSLALPFLDAMLPSSKAMAANGKVQRFLWAYLPNGYVADADKIRYSPQVLNVLNTIRSDITMVHGLRSFKESPFFDHIDARLSFIAGTELASELFPGGQIPDEISTFFPSKMPRTLDQLVGDVNRGSKNVSYTLCPDPFIYAPFPDRLNVAHTEAMSWEGPNKAAKNYTKPSELFNTLFKDLSVPPPSTDGGEKGRLSILHYVTDQIKSVKNKVGKDDVIRLDEYLTGVEELERKLAKVQTPAVQVCTEPRLTMNDTDYIKRMDLYYDIAFHAFQCDLTRSFTCLHSYEGSYRVIGDDVPGVVNKSHDWHGLSHDEGSTNQAAAKTDIVVVEAFHHNKIVNFVKRLKGAVQPNGKNLLDETAVVWGHGLNSLLYSTRDVHRYDNLRVNIAGSANGAFRMGQNVDAKGAPLANLWLALAQGFGSPITSYGKSTGPLAGIRS